MTGLEPATSSVTGWRSDQLIYIPKKGGIFYGEYHQKPQSLFNQQPQPQETQLVERDALTADRLYCRADRRADRRAETLALTLRKNLTGA